MQNRKILALILNSLIIMGEAVATYICFNAGGWGILKYYTVLSNLLLLASCLLFIARGGEANLFTKRFRLAATACVGLTFLVTATMLAPTSGPDGFHNLMFSGDGLYYHLLCPVLSFLSFICFEDGSGLRKKDALIPLGLTLIYALVTMTLNFMRLLYGPYFFLHVYEQSVLMSIVWFITIPGFVWLIALIFLWLNKKSI